VEAQLLIVKSKTRIVFEVEFKFSVE